MESTRRSTATAIRLRRQTRNGNVGITWNSTPNYLGTATGGTGQIDVASLQSLWTQITTCGGKPTLGITNGFGFAAIAIAIDAQAS